MRFIRKLKWVVFGLCLAAALTACKGQKTAVEKKATDAAESAETEEPSGSEDSSDAETGETAESEEEPESVPAEEAPEEPAPEGPTLLKMFRTAMQPVGQTMYVWGGGWNETDDGAGEDARIIGVSPRWKDFFDEQGPDYNFNDTRYQIHDGLDCSGYIGWVLYNTFEEEDGHDGYVIHAGKIAGVLQERGYGRFITSSALEEWEPGDIFCNSKHAGFVLGTCEDGSLLILHSSPPGLSISGTRLIDGTDSQAMALAYRYMEEHYPDWQAKFDRCTVPSGYLAKSYAMRWDPEILPDPEGLRGMGPEDVLKAIFQENE